MRKILFALPLTILFACSGNQENKTEKAETVTTVEAKQYVCPMQCGGKTYHEPGKCPVCNMDLQEVALAETDSSGHNH